MGLLALCLDSETSGLFRYDRRADHPDQPRLCSIAADLIDMETGERIDGMHRLCDGATWSVDDWRKAEDPANGGFKFNGLSSSLMMAEGVPITTLLQEFAVLEDRAHGYVGYSVDYDLKMLRGERRRTFLDDRYNYRPSFDPKWECRHLLDTKKQMTQLKMYEGLFGETYANPHTAKGDLAALVRIFKHACGCMPIEWKFHKSKGLKEGEAA